MHEFFIQYFYGDHIWSSICIYKSQKIRLSVSKNKNVKFCFQTPLELFPMKRVI